MSKNVYKAESPPKGRQAFRKLEASMSDNNIVTQSSPKNKRSKVSRLIELSYSSEADCNGNWWMKCPICDEDQLNFNPRKWQFYCFACEYGRHKSLSDLMKRLGIE